MKIEDVKIGMKVVPHSKSIGCSLSSSREIRLAKNKNQPYLYVIDIDSDSDIVLNCNTRAVGGDYFRTSDFEVYPVKEFKKGDIVEVSDDKLWWSTRKYFAMDDDKYVCYDNGCCGYYSWKYCRKIEEETVMTISELEEKYGIKNLKIVKE